jgi:phosphate transport system substrate-binding protein
MQINAALRGFYVYSQLPLRRTVVWLTSLAILVSLSQLISYAQQTIVLVGSGSSVPAPLYAKWAVEYNKRNPKIQMQYVPLGTSEGIAQISHGSGDFAAGELPLSAKERTEGNLVEVPSVLIAIVPIYNLPGIRADLHFSGELLAEIFLGQVRNWNAPSIAKLNPHLSLPDLPIKVVHRPAGKGSNYIFSEFLSKSSSRFKSEIGTGPSPKWPVGVSAERSGDMAAKVKNEPGAIGYVEAQYALQSRIPHGLVMNMAGKYVKATDKSITAACNAGESPGWDRFSASLINLPGADSYPITSFTRLYLRNKSADPARAAALGDLLSWMFTEGQRIADREGYSELPPLLLKKVKSKVSSLR